MDVIMYIIEAMKIAKNDPEPQGSMKCPKCGGKLLWRRVETNGHTHGKCQTENCLSWME